MKGFKFEEALKLLVQYFPKEKQKKPILFHSVRVGSLLWQLGYNTDTQIAGLLHDSLEDTSIPADIIRSRFGQNVLDIVEANSKNTNIENKKEMLEDIVKRCSEVGLSALNVKAADIYDNYLFYKKDNNYQEIDRCKLLSQYVYKYKKDNDYSIIIDKLQEVLNSDYPLQKDYLTVS